MVSEQATSIPRDLEAHLFARPGKDDRFQQPRRHVPRPERLASPLGVRLEVRLTDAQRTALQRLQDYDLSPVRARLMKQAALPVDSLDDAIFEFRRFLGLVVVGHEELPMVSPTVDEVWHTCLLFSRLYMDLCEQTAGQYIHHEPFSGPPKDARAKLDERRKFEEAYTRVYGEMASWLQPGRQQEANGHGGELSEADLERVAGVARSLVESPAPAVRAAGSRPLVTPLWWAAVPRRGSTLVQ